MIASHNTFSYMKSSWLMERFSKYWRCQNASAREQVNIYHVAVCDIRVKYHKGYWRLCHGKAIFGERFSSLEYLIKYCLEYGFKKYRLIYEDKSIGRDSFLKEWMLISGSIKAKAVCCIYNPTWEYFKDSTVPVIEHNKHMWYQDMSLWKNLKNILLAPSIREYALLNNTLPEEEDDSIHMFDYIQYVSYVK